MIPTVKAIGKDGVVGCLGVQTTPILGLNALHPPDRCNRRLCGGTIQQAIWRFSHQGLGHS